MSIENMTAAALDTKVRRADRNFMWLTEAHSCLGIRQTAESACNKAITLALNKVQRRFNAVELSLLKITKYPGFHVARVMFKTRKISTARFSWSR
jgi:hypothetical protein